MKVIVHQLKGDHAAFHREILTGGNNFKGNITFANNKFLK